MKKLALAGLAVAALGLLAEESQAFGRRRHACYSDCAPAVHAPSCAPAVTMQVSWVEKEVTAYRPVYKPYTVKETVYRAHTWTEKVPYKYKTYVPKWEKEKRTVSTCSLKPVVVDRDVVSCQYQHVTCYDPCTGCAYTTCVPQTVVHKVKATVYQPHWEKQEVWVNVCRYEEQIHDGHYHRVRCEYKPEVVERTYHRCEYEPYKTTVRVPVYTPVPCPAPAVVAHGPHCHH